MYRNGTSIINSIMCKWLNASVDASACVNDRAYASICVNDCICINGHMPVYVCMNESSVHTHRTFKERHEVVRFVLSIQVQL